MKIVCTLLAVVLLPVLGWGQACQPDTTIQANGGIFPDSATGIPVAYEGIPYQQTVTIIAPSDTIAVIIPGTPAQTVLIDSIVLDSVFTLPAWLTYECEPVDCAFQGGMSGCITFYGTAPVGEAGKQYSINFITRSHGRLLLLPTTPLPAQIDTTFNYYTLEVAALTTADQASDNEEISLYPNPAPEGFLLERSSTEPLEVHVFNTLGQLQWQSTITQSEWIPTTHWAAGMYWVQFKEKNKVSTRQILVP